MDDIEKETGVKKFVDPRIEFYDKPKKRISLKELFKKGKKG